ncbi:uncharacterized protein BO88DRAFT_399394 [Aspergillus vadensis CBS 113365]|uniref:Transmembrane protein 135 N-terminal domain-containing protein n=1 Tax=Aspergillus vadensis (strain CBS 113365 / IMI 142717 / IBT 24658) TaxID=1448311 RepID=A0A319ASK6_ASPVC|nr:hypothetical protein BO88DRAFT_399394 [Aspergillus vadensis CBS 113365]PYH63306.1 hypothetical protein BO88DRAFT_399394 [Aspergillus vadensis CBS 113365]
MASDSTPNPDLHPVVRNALRISLSAKEYKLLHDYAVQRTPSAIQNKLPSPSAFEAIVRSKNKHNEASIRTSLRVFVLSSSLLKLVDVVAGRIRGDLSQKNTSRTSFTRSPNFRLSISLSLLLLLHRFLYRFFVKLRANLRTDDARPFRDRNPRISRALTSRFAPAVGASIAGFALGLCPQKQLRLTAAIYTATRSLEFLFNALDEKGWFKDRPRWFGSWLLMPIACAQLFHAFIFDRETAPKWFGNVILRLSPSYVRGRPESLPLEIPWPEKEDVVDSLANIANLRWPAFASPILHPGSPNTLPSTLTSISPITGPAHPAISSLSCALLHPNSPSCSTAFLHHILLLVPPLARFLTTVTLALSLRNIKGLMNEPISSINKLSKKIITLTAILSASTGSAWGSICLWNTLLPRSALPAKRFFLSGALAGVPFAFLTNSRGIFMYFFRAAVDSAWKTGVKRGLWKGWKGGDLCIIVLAWALIGSILETRPSAVQGKGVRKALAWLKGDGFADPVEVAAKRKARKAAALKAGKAENEP